MLLSFHEGSGFVCLYFFFLQFLSSCVFVFIAIFCFLFGNRYIWDQWCFICVLLICCFASLFFSFLSVVFFFGLRYFYLLTYLPYLLTYLPTYLHTQELVYLIDILKITGNHEMEMEMALHIT